MANADRRQRGEIEEFKLPGPAELAVRAGRAFAKSPKAQSYAALWMFGLFCALYASAPYPTTEEQRAEFEAILVQSESVPGYDAALDRMLAARHELDYHKGWFWWMSSEASERVAGLQARFDVAERQFGVIDAQRTALRSEAFGVVGLWSEFGVQEARQLFWDCLEKGKGFAKRATFWDMLFGVTMGRDENIGAFLFRLAINFALNVTIGLIGVIVSFLFYLWSMVTAYQASLLSGLAFFAVAMVAGLSVAALYIFVIYGTIVGGGYLMVRAAVNAQLEGGGHTTQRQPQQIRYGRRPKYE